MRCLEVEAGRVFVVKSFGATRSTRRFGVGNYSTAFGSISTSSINIGFWNNYWMQTDQLHYLQY